MCPPLRHWLFGLNLALATAAPVGALADGVMPGPAPGARGGEAVASAALPGRHAVASAHPAATEAGLAILQAGGNAFDAAVAVSAALGVVEPYGSGLGGGGFWLLHRAADGHQVMIDGRERAPAAADTGFYLNADGELREGASIDGAQAAAIPGQPAALDHLARHYGRLDLATSLAPAIRLAREGFETDPVLRRMIEFRREVLARHPASAAVFLRDGQPPALGVRILQPDLAETLARLAESGAEAFYHGPLAARLVEGVRRAGGVWSLEDLAGYRVVERPPIRFRYRGVTVTAASPPSSGGVVLAQALQILEGFSLQGLQPVARNHLLVEALRRAYRDRARYLGDPDLVEMPLQRLLDPAYAETLRAGIRVDRATPSRSLDGPDSVPPDGPHTTHFSILDAEGNRVAATLSINYPFGSGLVVPGTGVLLNDEMDDFVAKPGVANIYGLVGSDANAIAPGKRPLSSMSPTFVETAERVGILGSPGGSRIISMVLLGILEFVDGREPDEWVARTRIHHQYLPDRIQFEPGALDAATQAGLAGLGHELQPLSSTYGNMQAVLWDRLHDRVSAASDPRGLGSARVVEALVRADAEVAGP